MVKLILMRNLCPCLSVMLCCLNANLFGQAIPMEYLSITPIQETGSASNELGWANSKINATSFKQQSLTTVESGSGDTYQFTSYYGADEKLVVGRRKQLNIGWSDWTLRRTEFVASRIDDAHDISSIAIDGDGYLHVSWGMHNDPLFYSRSTTPLTNDNPFTIVGDTIGNSGGLGFDITSSNSVTYPNFFNIPGSDDLFFAFRIGTSGNGDLQLHRWNDTNDVWNPVHAAPDSPWIDGDLPGDGIPSANAYWNYASFDSQGGWHTTWTWRTGSDSPTPFSDYQSNHNLMYAYSPNQGVDWYDSAGNLYERAGEHAIDESNATPVVNIAEGSSLINQTSMMVGGPNDTPYVASWWAPNADQDDHLRQYMLSWEENGVWKTSQITNREAENTNSLGISQRVPENQLKNFRMTRPVVAVDDEDRVIVAFTDWQRGRKLSIAYSESLLRDDWQIFDLPTDDMGWWEPTLDLNRWNNEGIISMLHQRQQPGEAPTTVSILEWDAKSYFTDANGIPFVFGDLDVNGSIGVEDWIILRDNGLQDIASLSPSQQYLKGDLDADGDNDLFDYAQFVALYDQANGAGAFASLSQRVPEPGALVLLLFCCGLVAAGSRS